MTDAGVKTDSQVVVDFTVALKVGDRVKVTWSSTVVKRKTKWEGTVLTVDGTNRTAMVNWANVGPMRYPPEADCLIHEQTKESGINAWEAAQERSLSGLGISGPSITDATSWGVYLQDNKNLHVFSQWLRTYFQVPRNSITQRGGRQLHEKNHLILILETWSKRFAGKADWNDTDSIAIAEVALARLHMLQLSEEGGRMTQFARRQERLQLGTRASLIDKCLMAGNPRFEGDGDGGQH